MPDKIINIDHLIKKASNFKKTPSIKIEKSLILESFFDSAKDDRNDFINRRSDGELFPNSKKYIMEGKS